MESKEHLQDEIELHKKLSQEYKKRYSYKFSSLFQTYWNNTLIDEADHPSFAVAFDLGCGNGILLKDLVKKFKYAIGLDASLDMVKDIKAEYGKNVSIIVGDGMNLPVCAEAFDVVFCRGTLHHLSSLTQGLEEIKICLKKDGVLIFSEPSNDSIIVRIARFIMYKFSSKFHEDDIAFYEKEVIKTVESTGFIVEKTRRFGFFAYVFLGFPDHFPLLKYIPFNVQVSRALIALDKLFARLPFVKNQSLHLIVKARRR
ncbi:class I SAM-dependent methyltransferase [Acidobacteriota bacterium]